MMWIRKNRLYLIVFVLSIFLLSGFGYKRVDFTMDKRYTVTNISKEIVKKIDKPIDIEIYLDGDFPASFKQLQKGTVNLLDELKIQNSKINYKFINPIKEKISNQSLEQMGMPPSVLYVEKDGVSSQIILFPYALVKYDKYSVVVPLLSSQIGLSNQEQIDKSFEELEYKFVNSFYKLLNRRKKNVGIIINHKELNRFEMFSFAQRIANDYNFSPIFPKEKNLNFSDYDRLKKYDAVIIAKPKLPFSEEEKILLDQYIMNGGKTMWLLDAVNAEMDTLNISQKIMSFPYDTNLVDLLFSYGVRINTTLVKDIKSPALITLQVGEIQGSPQQARVAWPYFPVCFPLNNHIITKNINPVKFEFPSPIDTLDVPGVKKTVLFKSSDYSQIQRVPSYISLEEAKQANFDKDNLNVYNKKSQILAILLEGEFPSAYADRIESTKVKDFRKKSLANKMIVVSDGDIAKNPVTRAGPLPLGFDISAGRTIYGNEDFLINSLDYLLDNDGIMSLKNKTIDIRILDKQEISVNKKFWQWINIIIPLVFIWIVGLVCIILRKKFYK